MNIRLALEIRRYICVILVVLLFIFSIGTNPVHALSESDMNSPTVLTSEGWKKIGYGGWGGYFNRSSTISGFDYAETLFKKAIDLDPGNADAIAGLARIIQLKGYIPQSVFKFNKDACRKALNMIESVPLRDDNFNIYYVKSEALLCLEDFDGAIREAEKLPKISDTCLSHIIKSMSYVEKYKQKKNSSDKDMAILEGTDSLECAQNRNQEDTGLARKNLSSILNLSKDYNSTIEYFKSNLESKPYSKWSYYNYVWVLLMRCTLDDLNEAEKTINKAKEVANLEIDPTQFYSIIFGDKYFELKQYDKAYNSYNKSLSINVWSIDKNRLMELCSKFNDGRCNEAWQKRIQGYLVNGDCRNAAEEFNVQYSLHPQAFEPLKDAVAQCIPKQK